MKCIVVVDNKWAIGRDNDLLFSLPKDMTLNFKPKTMGAVVIMGANTYYSLPEKHRPLSGRTNIVLDSSGTKHEGTISVSSVAELDNVLSSYDSDNCFVIGGASVYKLLLDRCSTAYVTKVYADGHGTVFFENLDSNENWQCVQSSGNLLDNNYITTYNTYVNKK